MRDPYPFPRPVWLERAIAAWSDLALRDAWMRERYGITGDRCPIVARPDRRGYVCLFHVHPVSDAAATVCAAREPLRLSPEERADEPTPPAPPVWTCGNTRCERPHDKAWHARTFAQLERTLGPRAADDWAWRLHPETDEE